MTGLFYLGLWAAVREVFPSVVMHGCLYHHKQAIMKFVKSNKGEDTLYVKPDYLKVKVICFNISKPFGKCIN